MKIIVVNLKAKKIIIGKGRGSTGNSQTGGGYNAW